MIRVGRIEEQSVPSAIACISAAQGDVNILSPIVIQIGESNPVTLLKVTCSGRRCDILKKLALGIAEHPFWKQRPQIRIASAAIEVQPPIIVEISEVMPHCVADP